MSAIEERFPRPSVMGVVNVTPDSFSDGGVNFRPEDAVASARRMVEEGAAIVDIGGESTRPGSDAVSADEELRRVGPVLEQLGGDVPVSIDTAKAEVARRAIELGAELVNDVTRSARRPRPGRGRRLVRRVPVPDAHAGRAEDDAGRARRTRTWPPRSRRSSRIASRSPSKRASPRSGSASTRASASERPWSRTSSSSAGSVEIVALGRPVLVGLSRKRSLGRILGDPHATTGPLSASLAAAVEAYERGAAIFRVHDVREHVEALTVAAAVPDDPRARGPRDLRPARRARGGAARRPGVPLRHQPRRRRRRRRPTGSRTPSTTERSPTACARSRTSRDFNLIEALAQAVADALVERFPVRSVRVQGDEDESRRRRRPLRDRQCRAGFFALTIEAESR